MASNYQITYPVDIVLCIDCTGSMRHIIDIVKNNALRLHGDLKAAMEKKSKPLGRTRVRVVAFRDYLAYMKDNQPPMLATPFYDLPAEADKFAAAVRGLEAIGGGDDDEDGLEALGFAMSSPWNTEEHMQRHIIALWTDAKPHELGFGRACPAYPQAMAKNLAELTAWWENSPQDGGKMPSPKARRLLLYAPDAGGWNFISDNWDQVVHYTTSLDNGVSEMEYHQIIDQLANSVCANA